MKHPLPISLLCLVIFTVFAVSGSVATLNAENASLADRYSKIDTESILLKASDWHPFPRADDRAAWERIPSDVGDLIKDLGKDYAAQEVPSLPATLYLDFQREGNRNRYEDVWFQRRAMLNGLALAECIEGKGRYLDSLANVAWAICEESSWTFPAHIGAQKARVDLPDSSEPIVALFSAETACSLAWVVYLLEDQLDEVSHLICKRIRREIDQRILTPYLEREDFRWMGFGDGRRPNNWNPWVNSNVLAATLLLERDEERRGQLVQKILRSLDRFFMPYPSDGSCDEGPSYWSHAGGRLFDNLELLYGATQGKFDVYDNPVVRNIGRYIYRVHVAGDSFVSIGDCDVHPNVSRDLIFRYGGRIEDRAMQDLGQSGLVGHELWSERGPWSLMHPLYAIFNLPKLRSATPSPPLLRDAWLSDNAVQLMAARDVKGSAEGLYLAAWGGHNAQSHNHNDVGNYIVYQNGQPALIDVGRPTYTRQTFSGDRYKIWAMQSAYHNLPTINGHAQKAGKKYAAKDVSYKVSDTLAELKMDLAPAYSSEAGIVSWLRKIQLVRGKSVEVTDDFTLKKPSSDIVQNLITPCEVEILGKGKLRIYDADSGTDLLVQYHPPELHVEVETIDLKDAKLPKMWGPQLRRILLRADQAQAQGVWTVKVTPIGRK